MDERTMFPVRLPPELITRLKRYQRSLPVRRSLNSLIEEAISDFIQSEVKPTGWDKALNK